MSCALRANITSSFWCFWWPTFHILTCIGSCFCIGSTPCICIDIQMVCLLPIAFNERLKSCLLGIYITRLNSINEQVLRGSHRVLLQRSVTTSCQDLDGSRWLLRLLTAPLKRSVADDLEIGRISCCNSWWVDRLSPWWYFRGRNTWYVIQKWWYLYWIDITCDKIDRILRIPLATCNALSIVALV